MFLFHSLDLRWFVGILLAVAVLAWIAHRVLRHRRWRRRLQRRRQIRARLYGPPVTEIDLRDPPARTEPAGPAVEPRPSSAIGDRRMAR